MKKSEVAKPESEKAESPIEQKTVETVQPEASPGVSSNLDNIADTLADSMPEVQEHAINQEKEKTDAAREKWADLKDTDGNGFDPELHKANKNGEPTVSPKGNLIKKPGRKATKGATASVIGVKQQTKPDPEAAGEVRAWGPVGHFQPALASCVIRATVCNAVLAAPLSMLSRAIATPDVRVSALPPTIKAAAAFNSTASR